MFNPISASSSPVPFESYDELGTALKKAVSNNLAISVDVLLMAATHIDAQDLTSALHFAADHSGEDVIAYFLTEEICSRIDPNDLGATILALAKRGFKESLIRLIGLPCISTVPLHYFVEVVRLCHKLP